MFGTEQGWRESSKPVHCETPEEVWRLAHQYARKPGIPVVRKLKPPPPAPRYSPPLVFPDAEVACAKVTLKFWNIDKGPRAILRDVAKKHGLSVKEMRSKCRKAQLVHARQEAAYRIRNELNFSLPRVAEHVGVSCHTTILWGICRYAERNGLPVPVFEKFSRRRAK